MPTAKDLLKQFKNIKTLPHVAIRLTRLLSDEETNMADFEKVINMDPTLVVRLLRVVNSAYYGLTQQVDSISRAVVMVGIKNLRSLVVASALKDIFKKGKNDDVLSRSQLWLHSVAVSICAKMISERIFGKMGEDAYLCGMIHDIGFIVEDQVIHDLIVQTCSTYTPDIGTITEHEKKHIGTDHAEIAYLLSQDWNLPVHVQDGIRYHHSTNKEIEPSSETGIIQLADYIASEMDYPAVRGMKAKLSPDLTEYLKKNSYEFKVLLQDLPEEIAKAEHLFNSGDN